MGGVEPPDVVVVMPTRILQALVAFDRPPELPEVGEISLSLVSPALRGFGAVEGPYPRWNMARPVRWIVGREAEVRFRGPDGRRPFILGMNVRSLAEDQRIEGLLNGVLIVNHPFKRVDEWAAVVSRKFTLAPENRLAFRAALSVSTEGRELSVLYDEIAFAEQ